MNSVSADFSEESAESAAAENEDPSMQSSEPEESDLENNLDSKKLLKKLTRIPLVTASEPEGRKDSRKLRVQRQKERACGSSICLPTRP